MIAFILKAIIVIVVVIIIVIICGAMIISAIAGMFAGIFGKKDKDCKKC